MYLKEAKRWGNCGVTSEVDDKPEAGPDLPFPLSRGLFGKARDGMGLSLQGTADIRGRLATESTSRPTQSPSRR